MGQRSRIVVLAAVVTVASLLLILFLSRQLEIAGRWRSIDEILRSAAAAATEQEALRDRLASSNDSDLIEQQARERLGMVMPGEEKIIFIEESLP